jgi:hypothetical protein
MKYQGCDGRTHIATVGSVVCDLAKNLVTDRNPASTRAEHTTMAVGFLWLEMHIVFLIGRLSSLEIISGFARHRETSMLQLVA